MIRDSLRMHRSRVRAWASLMILLPFVLGSVGCWEQVSPEWFPQMKRQAAVQAYGLNEFYGQGQGLTPPEGTVKLGNPYPDVTMMPRAEQEKMVNPIPSSLESLKNGEVQFQRFWQRDCASILSCRPLITNRAKSRSRL